MMIPVLKPSVPLRFNGKLIGADEIQIRPEDAARLQEIIQDRDIDVLFWKRQDSYWAQINNRETGETKFMDKNKSYPLTFFTEIMGIINKHLQKYPIAPSSPDFVIQQLLKTAETHRIDVAEETLAQWRKMTTEELKQQLMLLEQQGEKVEKTRKLREEIAGHRGYLLSQNALSEQLEEETQDISKISDEALPLLEIQLGEYRKQVEAKLKATQKQQDAERIQQSEAAELIRRINAYKTYLEHKGKADKAVDKLDDDLSGKSISDLQIISDRLRLKVVAACPKSLFSRKPKTDEFQRLTGLTLYL